MALSMKAGEGEEEDEEFAEFDGRIRKYMDRGPDTCRMRLRSGYACVCRGGSRDWLC
jgi:hypothetical protein